MNETSPSPSQSEDQPAQSKQPDRWLTIPNALCITRLVGSFALVPLAIYEKPVTFLIAYIALTSTDWIDGKIARWLDQKSKIGPQLDSLSDVTMYAALLFGTLWLFGDSLLEESFLIGAAVASYAVSCLMSLLKFRRFPSYHTRAAKISCGLTLAAVIALFLSWSIWPLRVAAFVVTLANLEAFLITLTLVKRQEDVPTLFHAWRRT